MYFSHKILINSDQVKGEFRSNFSRTHQRDATGNNGHRKCKKTLQSSAKTNKNLTFCSRPNKYNKQNFNKDLLKFYRNMKLRAHFRSTENN